MDAGQFVSIHRLHLRPKPTPPCEPVMRNQDDNNHSDSRKGRRPTDQLIDRHVGNRIRERRKLLGISRAELARGLDLSVQQIQKYESGDSTVSASRLHQIGVQLATPPSFFFEDLPPEVIAQAPDKAASLLDDSPSPQEIRQMITIYRHIDNAELRHQLYELARTLARAAQAQKPQAAEKG